MASKNNKSLGQHWLKNREILEKIADLAAQTEAKSPESPLAGPTTRLCLEVGPGLGTLTSSLLKRFSRVVAVEYDENLAKNLPKSFPNTPLEVIHADILDFDFGKLGENYVVAGNIPYYITSPIIEKVLLASNLPQRVVFLVQKEVAERIASERETVLSLWVKNRADVALGPVVPRAEFTPPPKVDSRVIILTPHAPVVSEAVFGLIRQGFRAPRKKLVHNLAGVIAGAMQNGVAGRKWSEQELRQLLGTLGLNPDARPGDLHLADWQKLAEKL